MAKNPAPPVLSSKYDKWLPKIELAVLLLFFGFAAFAVKSCSDNITVTDTSKLYKLCQEKGGILVDSQCFRERIELDVKESN